MKSFRAKRAAVLLTAIALLLAAAVGGTLAYLAASTGEVVNIFTPTSVKVDIEEPGWDHEHKEKVKIHNTGDIAAYIRVKVAVYFENRNGEVVSISPVEDTDYEIEWATERYGTNADWFLGSDGFWYCKSPVAANRYSTPLMYSCVQLENENIKGKGYYLDVDILTQAIQAVPTTAVAQAWGVTVDANGKISK